MNDEKPNLHNDTEGWFKYGEDQEKKLIEGWAVEGVNLSLNPQKARNKYAYDAVVTFPADIKTMQRQFDTASRYGIHRDYAVTINVQCIENYKKNVPNIILILNIDYGDYKGIRIAALPRILDCIELGKAKKHEYKDRKNIETVGAKDSYVFDYRWFPELR